MGAVEQQPDPLHVEDLEALCCPCGSASCTLHPSPACHPRAGISVLYRKAPPEVR